MRRSKTVRRGAEDVRHELSVAAAVVVVRGTRIGRLPLLAVAPAFSISPELQARGLFRYNTSERQVFTLEGERESTDAVIKLNGWPHMTRVEEIRYEPTFSSIFYFQYLFSETLEE